MTDQQAAEATDEVLLAHVVSLLAWDDPFVDGCPLCAEIERRMDKLIPHPEPKEMR